MVDIGAEKKQCFDDYKNGTLDDLIIRMIDDVLENNDLQASPTVWYCLIGIKKMLSEQRWIPVSEKYPKPEEEYKSFLTVDDEGEITIEKFLLSLDEEPQPYFTGMRQIIAWMPLPEPPKERSDKE